MGMIRGKVHFDRDVYEYRREVNGPSSFIECKRTGKWYDRETGLELKVEIVSLNDLFGKYCECGKEKDHE